MLKVFQTRYTLAEVAALKAYVHMAGHWTSTLAVYARAGLGVKNAGNIPIAPTGTLRLAEDAVKRFQSLPAGTHRVSIAHAGLVRLMSHTLILITPEIQSLMIVSTVYKQIMLSRTSYHIGAYYLTGRDRMDYDEGGIMATLGRITSFIKTIMPRSTLTKSPHAQSPEFYEDYDEHFESRMKSYMVSVCGAFAGGRSHILICLHNGL